jgi:hypothetical protein
MTASFTFQILRFQNKILGSLTLTEGLTLYLSNYISDVMVSMLAWSAVDSVHALVRSNQQNQIGICCKALMALNQDNVS